MYKLLILLMISIMHCADAMELPDTHIIKATRERIRYIRKKSGYNSKDLPAPFDESVYGVALRLNKKQNIVNTLLGGMYKYNPENKKWDHINPLLQCLDSHGAFVDVIKGQKYLSWFCLGDRVRRLVGEYDFPEYIYNENAELLVYPCEVKNNIEDRISYCDHNCVALATPYQVRYVYPLEKGEIKDVVLSDDGTYCGFSFVRWSGWRWNPNIVGVGLVNTADHQAKPICFPLVTFQGGTTNNSYVLKDMSRQTFFDKDNTLHALTCAHDKQLEHSIIPYPYCTRTRHQCLFDVGLKKEELISVGLVDRFPVLYKRLVDSQSQIKMNKKMAVLSHFVAHHIYKQLLPRDVVAQIISLYRNVDLPHVDEGLTFIYSPSDKPLASREKKASMMLSQWVPHCNESEEIESPVEGAEWKTADMWNAIQQAVLWEENYNSRFDYDKVSYQLWTHLFNKKNKKKKEKIYNLSRDVKVVACGQKIKIKDYFDGKEKITPLRRTFFDHKATLLKAQSYQDFVDRCAVKEVEKNGRIITVTLASGKQLTVERLANDFWRKGNGEWLGSHRPRKSEEMLRNKETCVIN